MERSPISTGALVVLVLVLAGTAVLALRPSSESVVVDDDPTVTAPADGDAVVHSLRAAGGFSLLGISIVDPTHTVEVQFLTGPGCAGLLTSGDPWPTAHAECASDVDVVGTVGGLGVMPSGQSLVGVTFAVSRDCYEGLERGMPWPPGVADC